LSSTKERRGKACRISGGALFRRCPTPTTSAAAAQRTKLAGSTCIMPRLRLLLGLVCVFGWGGMGKARGHLHCDRVRPSGGEKRAKERVLCKTDQPTAWPPRSTPSTALLCTLWTWRACCGRGKRGPQVRLGQGARLDTAQSRSCLQLPLLCWLAGKRMSERAQANRTWA
jgi:hypothetical protein